MKSNKIDQVELETMISDALSHETEDLLTRWVVIGEFISPDGTKYLERDWDPNMEAWDLDAVMNYDWQGE